MNRAIVRLSSKGQIVIPQAYRKLLNLTEGSELVLISRGDSLVLIPAADFAESSRGRLAELWGSDASGVDQAIAKERAGWR
ncbi:MAG: AbrB/MazE/SpoVT family DNA-binding domain-containing protein [Acidobacteria bacterium]|nr:AbrB/MazE/SpoVT family DNA-binding domain-containing protein [Acidobacteriota bacterium]